MKKKKSILFVLIVVAVITALGIYLYQAGKKKEIVLFKDVIDQVAVSVDGNNLLIRDMAFYVAYEERTVEDQALIYNEDDTNDYWNLHINGEFVEITARDAAMNMAVHDNIFFEMAVADDVDLDEEETALLESKQSDFWSDLSDEAIERLGVSQDDMFEVMRKMAISQKYQDYYASVKGMTYEDYNFDGDAYLALLGEHEVDINEDSWNRLDFGNITLDHYN